MGYYYLVFVVKDMKVIYKFYEDIMGFELVKVEVVFILEGGWGKYFFYCMNGDDSCFIVFWELYEMLI